ncbi:MAG: hypothetical protein ABR576_07845 [Thermoanaerobaculia bacterium]
MTARSADLIEAEAVFGWITDLLHIRQAFTLCFETDEEPPFTFVPPLDMAREDMSCLLLGELRMHLGCDRIELSPPVDLLSVVLEHKPWASAQPDGR